VWVFELSLKPTYFKMLLSISTIVQVQLFLLMVHPANSINRQKVSLLVALPEVCGSSSAVSSQLPAAAAAAISVANAALALANESAPFITISTPQAGACASSLSQLSAICDAVARDRPFAVIGPFMASSLSLTASALGAAGLPVMAFATSASDVSASADGEAAMWRSLVRVAPPEDVVVRAITLAIKFFNWEAVTLVTQGDAFGARGLLALRSALSAAYINVDASLSFSDSVSATTASTAIAARLAAGQPVIVVAWCDDAIAPILFNSAEAAGLFSSPLITWLTTSIAIPMNADASKFSGLLAIRPSPRDYSGSPGAMSNRTANAALLLASWPPTLAAVKPAIAALDPMALYLADSILCSSAALLDAWMSGAAQIKTDSSGTFLSWPNSIYTRSITSGSVCLGPSIQPVALSPLSSSLASALWPPAPAAYTFPFFTGPLTASLASRKAFNMTNNTRSAALSRSAYTLELANVQASGAVSVAMLFDSVTNMWSGTTNLTLTWPTGIGSNPPPDGSNLRGVSLRVLVPIQPPFVMRADDGTYSGYAIDVLRAVSASAGFSYTISVADSSLSYDEIVNQVAIGKVDLVIGDVTITEARQRTVDFSTSYYANSVRLVIKRPTALKPPLLAFLRPFSPTVWLAWLGSILLTALLIAVYEAGENDALPYNRINQHDPAALARIGAQALFFSMHANLGAGPAFDLVRFASKASTIGVMFASMILLATYTGAVSAALTAGLTATFLSSLSQIASGASPANRVGVMQGDSTEPLFSTFVSPNYFRAGTDYSAQLPNIARGLYDATVGDQASLGYLVATQFCDLVIVGDPYWPSTFGWVMPKSWSTSKRDAINVALLNMVQTGKLQSASTYFYHL
jgi:polar amino acid transport system substrate-binding protein